MNIGTPIYCNPAFCDALKAQFPKSQIISFSTNINESKTLCDALALPADRQIILLYKTDLSHTGNRRVVDHINLSHENPLIGPADLSKGVRFPDMSSVYESEKDGIIVVQGEDAQLASFPEPWAAVECGIWEAISLKHRSFKITAWLIADLQKWVHEQAILN